MKKLLLFMITALTLFACKKENDTEIKNIVEVGSLIWTTSNYSVNGKELFTYNECKTIVPPDGFRMPSVHDWHDLLKSQNSSITLNLSANNDGEIILAEGNFNDIKALSANITWRSADDEIASGTNTTGFNAKPAPGDSWVMYYAGGSTNEYAYIDWFSEGWVLGRYKTTPSNDDNKFCVRFVKDKN